MLPLVAESYVVFIVPFAFFQPQTGLGVGVAVGSGVGVAVGTGVGVAVGIGVDVAVAVLLLPELTFSVGFGVDVAVG